MYFLNPRIQEKIPRILSEIPRIFRVSVFFVVFQPILVIYTVFHKKHCIKRLFFNRFSCPLLMPTNQ
nr:MAG TPA: hypothetical protein [Caudoviricetes sp.]